MTGGEDEAVAVQPLGLGGVADEGFPKQHRPDIRRPEGQAKVAGVALVDGVHGETTGLIGSGLEQGSIHVQ
jgi:hypothetical protein